MSIEKSFTLLTGNSNPFLAEKVSSVLKTDVHNPVTRFADGESRIHIPINVRRHHVFIIQPTSPPVSENLVDLILIADAAKRASADEITAVIPYYGYSRQDKRDESKRFPISSSIISRIFDLSGVNRILSLDIHSEQQVGFFPGPWDNIYGSFSLVPLIKQRYFENLIIASPDKGGISRAKRYAKFLNAIGTATVYKERDLNRANSSEAIEMTGDVEGKNVLIIDDMIDTGKTIINAANLLYSHGARSIRAAATHGLFSQNAFEAITGSIISEIFITDTISQPEKITSHPRVTIASVSTLIAEAIKCILSGESISEGLILR